MHSTNPSVDIRPDQLAIVQGILSRHLSPDVKVWVFGSRATWTTKDSSDLDLALEGRTKIDHKTMGALATSFQDSILPYSVDVVDLKQVSGSFKEVVAAQKVLVLSSARHERWSAKTLGQLVTLSNGRTSPVRSNGLPHPVYGSNGIIGFSDQTNATENTIIIGRVGTYCGSLQYSERACWVTDNAIRANAAEENDSRFLFYLLHSLRLNEWRSGSGQPLLNQTILSSIPTHVPPLSEQHAIAHILGTLDDKIELNRRMNQTLEEMARAIFKDWFIDFGPNRAKMEGRGPYLPDEVWDLFPDSLVDSELGEMPEGWEVKPLGDLVELAYGKALKAAIRNLGDVPVYGSNGRIDWHDQSLVAGPGIVVGRKGNPGVVTWVQSDFFPIDTTFYVVPRNDSMNLLFLLHAMEAQNLPSVAADSAVPGLNRNLAYMNRQLVPDKALLDEFSRVASTYFERRHQLEEESRTLARQRDVLLPKLVSGELPVWISEANHGD